MVCRTFENDVKMYGTQTDPIRSSKCSRFENDVKMYGTQTIYSSITGRNSFENDVKMYGTQTNTELLLQNLRLRMM